MIDQKVSEKLDSSRFENAADVLPPRSAGTALLALLSPPQRPTPADGLRYLVPDAIERRTVSQHTVACPVTPAAPTQNHSIQIELECFTSYQGHFPPMSRDQILPPNSPELRLTRFRKRWRIVNGQYPALWFFWWGRDETGGAGTGTAPMAPQGWDRTPTRAYPLVKDPGIPTNALYPFPGPSRTVPSAPSGGGGGGAGNGSPMPPSGTPRTVGLPGQPGTPAQLSTNPLVRQEQLAALQVAQLAVNPSNLEARQAQFLAQQQAQARALAAAGVPPPVGYAAQMQQAQLLAQQTASRNAAIQQQQQIALANQRAAVAQAQAARKGVLPQSAQPAQPPAAFVAPSRELVLDSETPNVDIFDVLTSRQLAIHRLAMAQEALLPIFDPWSTTSILGGQKRKREVDEAIRSEAMDPRTGESKGGIAGFGREHTLTILGTSAARVAVHRAMGRDATKATYPIEDRKEKLNKMLEHIKKETELMEKKHKETVAKVKASPV